MALQEEFENEGNWLFRHRSYLPLVMLLVGFGLFTFQACRRCSPLVTASSLWSCYECLCLGISLVGFFIRVYTVGHTPWGTSGRNTHGQVASALNTTGIYSVVRHPLYLGNFLMYLGITLLTCHVGFIAVFILVFGLYYERIMYSEEQFLRRKFGAAYLSWAERTPAFFPRPGMFKAPALAFSWKKILKKEKNGLFALFLVFCIFDSVRALCVQTDGPNVLLLAAMLFSAVAYVILKVIKKHTHLLDEEGR